MPALRLPGALAAAALLLAGLAPAPSAVLAADAPRAAGQAVTPEIRAALAPTGKLRVGVYNGAPTSLVRDPVTGENRGVTVDLGTELARRLGVPVQLVEFERVAQVAEALSAGAIDFTVTNATPVREKGADFSDPILDIEQGYLVPGGSPIKTIADVDKAGTTVGVSEGSTSQANLTRVLKNAKIVTAPSLEVATRMVSSGQVQAYATNKSILFQMTGSLPGSHVLDGALGREHMSMGTPKGRGAGFAYLRGFAADAMAQGLVDRAVQRVGLKGSSKPQ